MNHVQDAIQSMASWAATISGTYPMRDIATAAFACFDEFEIHRDDQRTLRRIASKYFGTGADRAKFSIDTAERTLSVQVHGSIVAQQKIVERSDEGFMFYLVNCIFKCIELPQIAGKNQKDCASGRVEKFTRVDSSATEAQCPSVEVYVREYKMR